ncbi:hypothetical protein ABH309_19470, partial [Chromobacterium piscinae]
DRQVLFRSREQLAHLFRDFDDPCVMLHGNLRLTSIVKNARSDQLLAMTQPGAILWGPREYELMQLGESPAEQALMARYLQCAPVSEGFLWRRWLYQLWDCIDGLVLVDLTRLKASRYDRYIAVHQEVTQKESG